MSVMDEVISPFLKGELGEVIYEGLKDVLLTDADLLRDYALAAGEDLAAHVLSGNRAMTEEVQHQFMALLDVKRIRTTKRTRALVRSILWSVGQAALRAGIAAAASALLAKGHEVEAANMIKEA